jgi:hypothetical protein
MPYRGKAIAAGLGSAVTGLYGGYQAFKPTTLAGPVIRTDQGKPISGWTEMVRTASEESEETNYLTRRMLDKTASELLPINELVLAQQLKTAALRTEDDSLFGTTFDLEQTANLLGSSIINLALIS